MTPYVGQLLMVGFNFAPFGWMKCDGSVVQISDNSTLFNLIGTTYGGNGQTTFNIPDLRSRITVHMDPNNVIGTPQGVENVTLIGNQLPNHNHSWVGNSATANGNNPSGAVLGGGGQNLFYSDQAPIAPMNGGMISQAGNSLPHNNIQPYQVCNWIISMFGVYPSQG